MSYIYMDFLTCQNRKRWEPKGVHMEIFDSLENQFKEIQRILEARSIYIDTLEQFVRSCLPPFENQFYVSLLHLPERFRRQEQQGILIISAILSFVRSGQFL